MVQKLLLYNNEDGKQHPEINHEDQEIHGLSFEIIRYNGTKQFFILNGTEVEILAYIARNPALKETTLTELSTDAALEPEQTDCPFCKANGKIINPQYKISDLIEAKMGII